MQQGRQHASHELLGRRSDLLPREDFSRTLVLAREEKKSSRNTIIFLVNIVKVDARVDHGITDTHKIREKMERTRYKTSQLTVGNEIIEKSTNTKAQSKAGDITEIPCRLPVQLSADKE